MARFIKIGMDLINLQAVTRVQRLENQSGLSDRLLIEVGPATVIVDSVSGKKRMDDIWEKFQSELKPDVWDRQEELAPVEPLRAA